MDFFCCSAYLLISCVKLLNCSLQISSRVPTCGISVIPWSMQDGAVYPLLSISFCLTYWRDYRISSGSASLLALLGCSA